MLNFGFEAAQCLRNLTKNWSQIFPPFFKFPAIFWISRATWPCGVVHSYASSLVIGFLILDSFRCCSCLHAGIFRDDVTQGNIMSTSCTLPFPKIFASKHGFDRGLNIFKKNRFTAHLGLVFNTLFVHYYSVICRPSDHTVGRPRAEIRVTDFTISVYGSS